MEILLSTLGERLWGMKRTFKTNAETTILMASRNTRQKLGTCTS
jgi:hypothetical protein